MRQLSRYSGRTARPGTADRHLPPDFGWLAKLTVNAVDRHGVNRALTDRRYWSLVRASQETPFRAEF